MGKLKKKSKILILDNDQVFLEAAAQFLDVAVDVELANNTQDAFLKFKTSQIDLTLCEIDLEKLGEGINFLKKARELSPQARIVMFSGNRHYQELDVKVLGAQQFINKFEIFDYLKILIKELC